MISFDAMDVWSPYHSNYEETDFFFAFYFHCFKVDRKMMQANEDIGPALEGGYWFEWIFRYDLYRCTTHTYIYHKCLYYYLAVFSYWWWNYMYAVDYTHCLYRVRGSGGAQKQHTHNQDYHYALFDVSRPKLCVVWLPNKMKVLTWSHYESIYSYSRRSLALAMFGVTVTEEQRQIATF